MWPDCVFCRLCECPVVDGGVRASEVDRDKFEEWCLDVVGEELAEELEEGDVICYFCVWDAETLLRSQENKSGERLEWWPISRNNDVLQETLKRNYLAEKEKLKLCWVVMEKVSLPQSDEEETESGLIQPEEKIVSTNTCIYCGEENLKSYKYHMKIKHKDVAIRCEKRNCNTYFHTLDQKEKHTKQVHETPKEQRTYKCIYCTKCLRGSESLRYHVRKVHSDKEIKCDVRNCICYFNSQDELNSHFEVQHAKEEKSKTFHCKKCHFRTKIKNNLTSHISNKHLAKTIKCELCEKMFSTGQVLKLHMKLMHSVKNCVVCHLNVSLRDYPSHFRKHPCKRCKNEFLCSSLFQSHVKTCKERAFECGNCGKSFKIQSKLEYHLKTHSYHTNHWKGLNYKDYGFKCQPCKRYYSCAETLKIHFQSYHNLKSCAHCPKKLGTFFNLQNHLAMAHNLIEKKFECLLCPKKFFHSKILKGHVKYVHNKKITLKKCRLCDKQCKYLHTHMISIHGVRE